MALQLSEEQASGVSGDYWKIRDVVILGDDRCLCVVELYLDQASRDADKRKITQKNYNWELEENPCTVEELDLVGNNPFKLCYDKLKTLDEFTGAVDV